MRPLYCTIIASIGGVVVALAFGLPALAFLLPYGGLVFFISLAVSIGLIAFPAERAGVRLAFGFLGVLALLAVFGGGTYYFYALDEISIACLLIVLPWLVFSFSPFLHISTHRPPPELLDIKKGSPLDTAGAILFLMAIGFDVVGLRWLFEAATVEAIRSPWDVVPPMFFLWFFLASFSLITLCYRNRYHHASLVALSFHLFTALSPALLVYSVGFGFDPFIHIATEKLIVAAGSVSPKPLYYLGQYAIVATIAKIFRLSVDVVDHLLVPGLAAIYLPLSAVYLLRRGFKLDRHLALLTTLSILVLPLATFTVTTPQGLGNLFAITTVLLGATWLHDHRPSLPYVVLLALAALAIHPLSGIPAILFAAFAIFFKLAKSANRGVQMLKVFSYLLLFGAAASTIPILFTVFAKIQGASSAFHLQGLFGRLWTLWFPGTFIESRFKPLLDFIQLAVTHRAWMILLLAAVGAMVLLRRAGYRRTALVCLSVAGAVMVSALVIQAGLSVPGVIDYERTDYGNRLVEVALLLLTPLFLAGSAWWWRNVKRTDASVRIIHILLFAALMTSFAYAAFPRHDDFITSRGYSVSRHDLNAVREIDLHTTSPYIALADQSVSAAALREFGFRSYYQGQYFYPIPTGGPLYNYYLSMVYTAPSRATMNAAMRSVGVHEAFFVINDYWTNASAIIEQAKKDSDDWFEIDGGKLIVFEYHLAP